MEHTFGLDEKNKSLPSITGKDSHPLQGPNNVLFLMIICGFILSLQTKALYAPASSLQSVDDCKPRVDQQSESAGKWEICSENCPFPRLSTPLLTSILLPKVCSPVRCQVDDLTPRCVMLS